MAKVLISFLGTAQPESREYRKAKYHFSNDEEYEFSFIAKALSLHYQVDKIILIGTVKSMWEEVYRQFAEDKNCLAENVYLELSDFCKSATHESLLELPHKKDIEDVLGNNSKILLIKYGLNEKEINDNSYQILSLEQYLNNNDELYVDITHSFRSLPLFLMNSLIYLQNVSQLKIAIKSITYGMLDISREMGYTPVVELNELLRTNEWISGAYSFMEFGDAYKIANLLSEMGYKDISSRLTNFSDAINLNYFDAIEKQVQELQAFRKKEIPPIAQMVVMPIVDNFIKEFANCETCSKFQYKLALWHYERHNYASAFIVLAESIVSYACETSDLDEKLRKDREKVKKELRENQKFSNVRKVYSDINNIRNQVAHNLQGEKSSEQMLSVIRMAFEYLKEVI